MTRVAFFAGLGLVVAGVTFIYWPAGVITAGLVLVALAFLLRKVPDAPVGPSARPNFD